MFFRKFIDKKFSFLGEARPGCRAKPAREGLSIRCCSCPIYLSRETRDRAITALPSFASSRAGRGESVGEDKKSLRKEVKTNEDYQKRNPAEQPENH
jgi:hypothetical protein